MNGLAGLCAAVAGVLTIVTGDVGLGMLWIVVGTILLQMWAGEKHEK